MESSSEISFTWTDASSDSIDSHTMAADESLIDKSVDIDKQSKRTSIDNRSKTKRETKVSSKKQLHSENYSSPQSNMVKVEPESDCDISSKKLKLKHVETNGVESYDESYLNLKVKLEDMTASASGLKIKKKKNVIECIDDDLEMKKQRVKETSPDSYNGSPNIQSDTEIKIKKKKKKSKRKRENEEEIKCSDGKDCDDIMNYEEIDPHSHTKSLAENTFEHESCDEISAIQCDDPNIHTLSFNSSENGEKKNKKESLYKSAIINKLKKDKDEEVQSTNKLKPRLSDRIQFEDEDDSEPKLNHSNNSACYETSLKLKKYMQTTANMKLLSQELHYNTTLTCDDEIWIVQCPKEIDLQGFCDADLNMHGKSKIKLGGLTYDGMLEEECGKAAVLTMEHGKYEITNIPLSGILQLRKRIPKAHFLDDNIMVNNQTNFIPLPDTKCRHPLFGSNYKKALKIPTSIAKQLNSQNAAEETLMTERRKRKKHKKGSNIFKHEDSDSKCDGKPMLEPELILNANEKKKKKRKHSDDEGTAPKRVKKVKHDPESAEAWESEKAIEQNLFSF